MSVDWVKSFFRKLSIFKKFQFVTTKLLRRIVSDLGKKNHFDKLYEFYLLSRIRGSIITEDREYYIVKYESMTYLLRKNTSDIDVFIQVVYNHEYKFIVNLIKKNDIPINTMIDAGANIGLTSLLFTNHFQDIQILAIEPDADNFNTLQKNILNSKRESIKTIKGGLTPINGWLSPVENFSDNREWSKSFKMCDGDANQKYIKGYCVDELLKMAGWNQIDFLKIDIEGGEKDIFTLGTSTYLFLRFVKIIAIEIHDTGKLRDEIYSILVENNFFIVEEGELTIGIRKDIMR